MYVVCFQQYRLLLPMLYVLLTHNIYVRVRDIFIVWLFMHFVIVCLMRSTCILRTFVPKFLIYAIYGFPYA